MKIIENGITSFRFKELVPGTDFLYCYELYVKVKNPIGVWDNETKDDVVYNAFKVETAELVTFCEGTPVTPVLAEVNVSRSFTI